MFTIILSFLNMMFILIPKSYIEYLITFHYCKLSLLNSHSHFVSKSDNIMEEQKKNNHILLFIIVIDLIHTMILLFLTPNIIINNNLFQNYNFYKIIKVLQINTVHFTITLLNLLTKIYNKVIDMSD